MADLENNPTWMPVPALWTVRQCAAYLNVSTTTIWNLLAHGQLVRRRIGNCTRIPKTSIEHFLKRDHETGIHRKKGSENAKSSLDGV